MGADANAAAADEAGADRSDGADAQTDRWESMNARRMLVCRLSCYDGTYYQGSHRAMCDMNTGFWFPTPGHCKAFDGISSTCSQPMANHGHYHCRRVHGAPKVHALSHGGAGHHHGAGHHGPCPARIVVQNGFTQCQPQGHGYFCMLMCHKGFKPATSQIYSGCSNSKLHVANMRCVSGYCDPHVHKRACFGVTMDNEPGHHHHGHHHHRTGDSEDRVDESLFESVNEDAEGGARKRRHDDGSEHEHNEDGSHPGEDYSEADEFGDVWFTKAVGRGFTSHTHLVCDLNCAPGMVPLSGQWVAKCDEHDGQWAVPPTHCDSTKWTPQCNQKQVNGGYITCGHQVSGHHYSSHCHLNCHAGFSPRDPHRTEYTCNFASGAFSPQPIGCRPDHLPDHPSSCGIPSDLGGGHWKCYLQDFDAPYPPASRTEEWDTIEHVAPPTKKEGKPGRRRRHDDGTVHVHNDDGSVSGLDYFSDEQKPVKSEHENKHTKLSKKQIGRWGVHKPQNYVCMAKCHGNAVLSGSYLSVCRIPTNSWIVPPAAWCHSHLSPAKYCRTPHVNNGYYVCQDTGSHSHKVHVPTTTHHGHEHGGHGHSGHAGHGGHGGHAGHGHGHGGHAGYGRKRRQAGDDRGKYGHGHKNNNQHAGGHGHGHAGHTHGTGHIHQIHHGLLKCSLRCNPGYRPANGRWTSRCDQNNGIWQIPATHCVEEVKTCMDVPTMENGFLQCDPPSIPHSHPGTHGHGDGHGHRTEGDDENDTAADSEEDASEAAPAEEGSEEAAADTAEPGLIGASGSCQIEPAVNEVKGGSLRCREANDGTVMCMIMCDEGFRPWHGELIIFCRDGVFYNRNNPLEVQKNMKCKELPEELTCNVEKYGIACFNHPNRARRDAEFDALSRSIREADDSGEDRGVGHGGHGGHGGNIWHKSDARECHVKCNEGYEVSGSNMAICNTHTGKWELTPGTCNVIEEEKGIQCVPPQSGVDNGTWKCKLTMEEGDMRGEGFVAMSAEDAAAFAEYNTHTMAQVTERGLWDLVPGFENRKRRDSDADWNMQLARHASEQYLVCWIDCKDGYEPKDSSLSKISCRMSDAKWIKPYKKSVHQCKESKAKNMVPYCEDPAVRPTYVSNGEWKNCNLSKGKMRCDLNCNPGYIPDGNGKWVCEDGKVTHPVHSCKKLWVPPQASDCRTPHLDHGVYACSWNKECQGSDDHHVHRRETEEERGKHSDNNKHSHDKTKNMCKRDCTLECDVGWKSLSGSKEATCVRHTREWTKETTICVPTNFKEKGSNKGDEFDIIDAPVPAPEPVDSAAAATSDEDDEDVDGNPCGLRQETDKDTGWGYGQCPSLTDEDQPCLPSVPLFDEGKEKLSSKIKWDCDSHTGEGAKCVALCGPSAIRTAAGTMTCTCKDRKNKDGVKNKMCTWSGKIKDHCKRMMCPALAPVSNGGYIQTPKKMARKLKRMSMEPVSMLQTRWGKQYKNCPTGMEIPKSKVKCLLQCNPGFVLKAAGVVKRANTTKASCQCKEDSTQEFGYRCWWDHKARECVSEDQIPIGKTKTKKNKKKKKKPVKG